MKPKVVYSRVFFNATGDDVGELLRRNVQVEYLLAEGLPVSQKNGCQGDNCQKGVLCVAEELLLLAG